MRRSHALVIERRVKRTLWFVLIFMLSIFLRAKFGTNAAYAAPVITIDLPESANLDLTPGHYGSVDLSLSVTINSASGYNLFMHTGGTTTNMISTINPAFVIPTITLPAGSTSVPATSVQNGYAYSTDGTNFKPAPSISGNGDLIAQMTNVTPDVANTHTITFGAEVGTDVRAGGYTQTFIFRVVANNPEFCGAYTICYYGNDDDGRGTMPDQTVSSNAKVILMPSNFSRAGYGFAGWNTEEDGTGTTYGPSQSVKMGNMSSAGLKLYAKWIPSAGNLQDWDGCPEMDIGDITALTDTRDGNTYAVAKLADGRCWMVENARLDFSNPSVTINATNTNNPTSAFITAINNHPIPTNDFCASNTTACVDQIKYNLNNIDRRLPASYNTQDNQSSWYSYGGYYNWFTATAGNGTYSFNVPSASVSGDICPSGWRLPGGYSEEDDFARLDIALGGTGVEQTTAASSEKWRAYPNNFILSGEQRSGTTYNRNTSGSYNASSIATETSANNLWLRKTAVTPSHNTSYKYRGQTIRCLAKEQYTSTNTVHYEANGGSGTMPDDEDVDFSSDFASANQFTRTYYEFLTWNTKADGTGVVVAAGGPLESAASSMGVEDGGTLTLYATWRPVYNLYYDGNGADAGSMSTATQTDIKTKVTLVPSNFSRAGYGFAGWSFDPDAGTKLKNHQSVEVYGPNQVVTLDNAFFSHANAQNNITLYAVWVPADSALATRTMQNFTASSCSAMSTGHITALVDERDNNTYAVAKLADGHCWMIENLRLVPSSTTFTSANTNSPTAAFISEAPSSSTSTTLCNKNTTECIDQIQFNTNNINRSLTPSYNTNGNNKSWYSYGMMYNWYTATAGNGTLNMSTGDVTGDICPSGWRLPTGALNGEFYTLNRSGTILNFPYNFIYSGDYNNKTTGGRSTFGRWWTSTTNGQNSAYRMGAAGSGNTPTGSWNKWDGFAVRCIVK